jgi:hypothetical protein
MSPENLGDLRQALKNQSNLTVAIGQFTLHKFPGVFTQSLPWVGLPFFQSYAGRTPDAEAM